MKRMGAVESDSVKSARKAKDKLHKACERASETRERTLHGQEQNRMRMASLRESRDSDRFLVNTQVQSHALLRRGFGTSVPFIMIGDTVCMSLNTINMTSPLRQSPESWPFSGKVNCTLSCTSIVVLEERQLLVPM